MNRLWLLLVVVASGCESVRPKSDDVRETVGRRNREANEAERANKAAPFHLGTSDPNNPYNPGFGLGPTDTDKRFGPTP